MHNRLPFLPYALALVFLSSGFGLTLWLLWIEPDIKTDQLRHARGGDLYTPVYCPDVEITLHGKLLRSETDPTPLANAEVTLFFVGLEGDCGHYDTAPRATRHGNAFYAPLVTRTSANGEFRISRRITLDELYSLQFQLDSEVRTLDLSTENRQPAPATRTEQFMTSATAEAAGDDNLNEMQIFYFEE